MYLLQFSNNQTLQLDTEPSKKKGLKIKRFYTRKEIHPYNSIQWEKKDIRIQHFMTGKVSFERLNVEVPSHWNSSAINITADKYLFGKDPAEATYEDSFKHIFDRIANTYVVWAWKHGYITTEEDALAFADELKYMLVNQIWAPNSPVWFNIGHNEQWRWGRPDPRPLLNANGIKHYHGGRNDKNEIVALEGFIYDNPQCSACFLTEVGDSMQEILEHIEIEGKIFSAGSGVGINLSSLRSSYEPITGKGSSSGPLAFDSGFDRMAGAIKSGGKTRRAARMVIMDSDHPNIWNFIASKDNQEDIAKVILHEHNVMYDLRQRAEQMSATGNLYEKTTALNVLSMPYAVDKKFSNQMDDLLYGETLANQNANHSVSLQSSFWQGIKNAKDINTYWVTDKERVQETFSASLLLDQIAHHIWSNGEPGIHNSDIINLWNPVASIGKITTSNPCSEYLHLNNTSCNLSSFNIYRFWNKNENNNAIQFDALRHCTRLAMICADLNVECGGFPTMQLAKGTYTYRTTGIGFTNLGGTLMAQAISYDSDEARYYASLLTTALNAYCWETSAELGNLLGSYPAFEQSKDDVRRVINLHKKITQLNLPKGEKPVFSSSGTTFSEEDAKNGYLASFTSPFDKNHQTFLTLYQSQFEQIIASYDKTLRSSSLRNSFVSLMAPTGTISAPLGCYDEGTTSIEPDYSLVKYKQLSGGGTIALFNTLALQAMHKLRYPMPQICFTALELAGLNSFLEACKYLGQDCNTICAKAFDDEQIRTTASYKALVEYMKSDQESPEDPILKTGHATLEIIPWIKQEHLPIFDCATTNGNGKRYIQPEGHLRMLAAIQPFISGASSKTINLPPTVTPEEIAESIKTSHAYGIKCIALFRAGSKANGVFLVDTPETRKLNANYIWDNLVKANKTLLDETILKASKPKQRKLPGRRNGETVKFTISGSLSGYLTVGCYKDQRCGEIFGRLGQVGTFTAGLFEAICKLMSHCLQYGVPLQEIIDSFKNFACEPSGFCRVGENTDDNPLDIKSCSSVVDLVAKILSKLFPEENGYRLQGSIPDTMDIQAEETLLKIEMEKPTDSKPSLNSANICPQCNALAYAQDGKCKSCRSCGFKDGGCGE